MIRRRLDAESIRDNLLSVAGRLGGDMGGPSFADLAVPRRHRVSSIRAYGPGDNRFRALFDRADPGSIVGKRGESVVAPQALFFLNDPFVMQLAQSLAARIAREEPAAGAQNHAALCPGSRPASAAQELDLGLRFVAAEPGVAGWERYCQLIVSQSEFLYID